MERDDDTSVDVQALQREVALLKTLLHQERTKSSSSNSSSLRELSPTRPASPSKASVAFKDASDETSPRKSVPMTISSSQRARNMRYGNGRSTSTGESNSLHTPLELQLVPVDTKRGKWWLKDRQVLSRNAPSPTDNVIAMKVRETWLWSGRTVVVDKIVTYATAPAHHESDDNENDKQSDPHSRPESFLPAATVAIENEAGSAQAPSTAPKSPSKPSIIAPAAVAVSTSESPVKQLAHEFLQPKASDTSPRSTATVDRSDPTARMEHQMEIAAQEAAAPQASSDEH